MKLGNQTIGLRKHVPRVDGNGNPTRDDYGDPVVDVVDIKVRWCSVTPTTARSSDNDEPEDRSAPLLTGMTLLTPPNTAVTAADEVVWPITAEETVEDALQLSGPVWQVTGEPGIWDEAIQAQLRKAT